MKSILQYERQAAKVAIIAFRVTINVHGPTMETAKQGLKSLPGTQSALKRTDVPTRFNGFCVPGDQFIYLRPA
jgi:hypothetical protein